MTRSFRHCDRSWPSLGRSQQRDFGTPTKQVRYLEQRPIACLLVAIAAMGRAGRGVDIGQTGFDLARMAPACVAVQVRSDRNPRRLARLVQAQVLGQGDLIEQQDKRRQERDPAPTSMSQLVQYSPHLGALRSIRFQPSTAFGEVLDRNQPQAPGWPRRCERRRLMGHALPVQSRARRVVAAERRYRIRRWPHSRWRTAHPATTRCRNSGPVRS